MLIRLERKIALDGWFYWNIAISTLIGNFLKALNRISYIGLIRELAKFTEEVASNEVSIGLELKMNFALALYPSEHPANSNPASDFGLAVEIRNCLNRMLWLYAQQRLWKHRF